jgi:hypothetical protein
MCRFSRTGAPVLLVGLVFLAGCKTSKLPKTNPARGSVFYQGGQPMKGGSIQFLSLTDPDLRVSGKIQNDGTFTLETLKDRDKIAGAPEGEYRVSILPPLEGDHKGVPPISVPGTKTVMPGENQFKLELDIPPPKS